MLVYYSTEKVSQNQNMIVNFEYFIETLEPGMVRYQVLVLALLAIGIIIRVIKPRKYD